MKISYLLTQDLGSPSGLGRYFPLAKELARLGHQVTIHALHPEFLSLSHNNLEINGVRVHYVAPMHVLKKGNTKSYYSSSQLIRIAMQATQQLWKAAQADPASILHIAKPHPMNSLAGLFAARGRQLYLDCDDYEAGSGVFQSPWQKKVVGYFENTIPTRVDYLTTNTSFNQQRLISLGIAPDRIFYLSNGVDPERFLQVDPEVISELRQGLDLENKAVISFIGSISRASHPLDLLLAAFQQVLQKLPHAVLLLVGGGDDYLPLIQKVDALGLSQYVRFCGRIDPAAVGNYYRLSHVSVDPVNDDDAARGRSPLKLFESWACGVPFVSADVGDRKALMGSTQAGLLAKPGDPTSLANCLIQVLESPALASVLTTLGTERMQSFTWSHLARELEAVYYAHLPAEELD